MLANKQQVSIKCIKVCLSTIKAKDTQTFAFYCIWKYMVIAMSMCYTLFVNANNGFKRMNLKQQFSKNLIKIFSSFRYS